MVETTEREWIRVNISLPWDLLTEFDDLIKRHGYTRSEAVREAMRGLMEDLRKRERYKELAGAGGEKG